MELCQLFVGLSFAGSAATMQAKWQLVKSTVAVVLILFFIFIFAEMLFSCSLKSKCFHSFSLAYLIFISIKPSLALKLLSIQEMNFFFSFQFWCTYI